MGSPAAPVGPPFDIPPFTISGVLPPYLGPDATTAALMCPYETTLVRIASTLCKSKERKLIFQGLLQYRQKLASIGFTDGFQWLSGSFMEDIETLEKRPPNDIDVVTFVTMPATIKSPAEWLAFITANLSVLDPQQAKAAYKCDAYFVDLRFPPQSTVAQTRYWFGLYSHRRNGLWKGLLQVPLAITQDDADASKLVVVP
jgi:hypothetical protein